MGVRGVCVNLLFPGRVRGGHCRLIDGSKHFCLFGSFIWVFRAGGAFITLCILVSFRMGWDRLISYCEDISSEKLGGGSWELGDGSWELGAKLGSCDRYVVDRTNWNGNGME